jgi:hypothetical protein
MPAEGVGLVFAVEIEHLPATSALTTGARDARRLPPASYQSPKSRNRTSRTFPTNPTDVVTS